jgi:hypothetical protein
LSLCTSKKVSAPFLFSGEKELKVIKDKRPRGQKEIYDISQASFSPSQIRAQKPPKCRAASAITLLLI